MVIAALQPRWATSVRHRRAADRQGLQRPSACHVRLAVDARCRAHPPSRWPRDYRFRHFAGWQERGNAGRGCGAGEALSCAAPRRRGSPGRRTGAWHVFESGNGRQPFAGQDRGLSKRDRTPGSRAPACGWAGVPAPDLLRQCQSRRPGSAGSREFLVQQPAWPAHPQHDRAPARVRSREKVSLASADAWRPVFTMAGCLGAALELPPAFSGWLCVAADQLRRLDQPGRGIRAGHPG